MLTTLEATTIARAVAVSKRLLEEVKPVLDSLDLIYNSGSGVSTTLTQEDLDSAAQLSGITKTQVDDAVYALTLVKTQLTTSYTALATLAARG